MRTVYKLVRMFLVELQKGILMDARPLVPKRKKCVVDGCMTLTEDKERELEGEQQ